MLVISRKAGQSFVISDNIVVTVVSIDKDVVKIGIDAAKDIKVLRSELLDKIKDSMKNSVFKEKDMNSLLKVLKDENKKL
ncbi:carbon storage regulator [Thermodesulfobium narugense DSM 14796]|uniref:Translational regulator CsrA n=1 Tax=Thermodesulfobium narugense DSM 14796 TaxID=747365 RepID=M1E5U1_9BACT|nr:carbon storage regulator [Thermodesulfobium narugense]AEE13823.1 carbon storage regulator [Thermodesulfobium narugense DSM 14796]